MRRHCALVVQGSSRRSLPFMSLEHKPSVPCETHDVSAPAPVPPHVAGPPPASTPQSASVSHGSKRFGPLIQRALLEVWVFPSHCSFGALTTASPQYGAGPRQSVLQVVAGEQVAGEQ